MLAPYSLQTVEGAAAWLNDNEGVLALVLFVLSAGFAWFSGIIAALRRRPILRLAAIVGPTLCVVHPTGRLHNGFDTHRVLIAIYLRIANSGSAPTSIGDIHVGYSWVLPWWKRLWRIHWITHQTVARTDFQVVLEPSGDVKFFPFLTQRSVISGDAANSYLDIGEMANGVIYFEGQEAWGACQPLASNGYAWLRLRVFDAFGGRHSTGIRVPVVDIAEAKKYNPSFGESLESLDQSTVEPVED